MVPDDSEAPDSAPPPTWIPVERIRAYERNPRHAENPAYSEIKESIRVDGMLQPLIVTRRQGEEDYVVSQSLFSYIEYAVKRLGPLLPSALESGIGRRQVKRIRSLEKVAEAVWTTLSAKGAEVFAPAFEAACRKCDGPNWNLAALRYEVESEIACHVHVGLDTVREKLAIHLDGVEIKSGDVTESSAIAGVASVGIVGPARPSGEPSAPANSNGTGYRDPDDKTIRHDRPQPTEPFGEASEDSNPDMSASEATLRPPPDQSRLMDLKSLRARAWTLAQRIAQRHGLENLIQPLVGKGLGFVVRDVPDAALLEQLAEDALAQVSTVWWQLAACAETTVAPLSCTVLRW
jgi:hypothetical protein